MHLLGRDVKPVVSLVNRLALVKLKADELKCREPEDYVDLAFSWKFPRIPSLKPLQIRSEILELLSHLKVLQPKHILEIGTEKGGTLYLFTKVAPPDAKILSVSLYAPDTKRRLPLYRSFASKSQTVEVILGDSHDPRTLREVSAVMNGRVNFLFIDGDHTYRGVREDFEMYSPLVTSGGIIAFHDIASKPSSPDYGVTEFWSEVKSTFKHHEIIEDQEQNGAGIGMLFT